VFGGSDREISVHDQFTKISGGVYQLEKGKNGCISKGTLARVPQPEEAPTRKCRGEKASGNGDGGGKHPL